MVHPADIKVVEFNASDNQYLHKDFHGALCYSIQYLDQTFGPEATAQYLGQVGQTVYQPLIAALKREGLVAMERHIRHIFQIESGEAEFEYEGDQLIVRVSKCPAVMHLCSRGALFTNRFCETTVNVNEAICKAAGYQCSCDYEPGQGRCIQRFWKEKVKGNS